MTPSGRRVACLFGIFLITKKGFHSLIDILRFTIFYWIVNCSNSFILPHVAHLFIWCVIVHCVVTLHLFSSQRSFELPPKSCYYKVFLCLLFVVETVPCSPGWFQTCHMAKSGLELLICHLPAASPPAASSRLLSHTYNECACEQSGWIT